MVVVLNEVIASDVSGAVSVELSVGSCVGGAKVSDLPRVTILGLCVGTFVDAVAGRPVGVRADTGNGAFVAPVVWDGVSLGSGVIVVVGNVASVVNLAVVVVAVFDSFVVGSVVTVVCLTVDAVVFGSSVTVVVIDSVGFVVVAFVFAVVVGNSVTIIVVDCVVVTDSVVVVGVVVVWVVVVGCIVVVTK